jgi:chemotaxis protein methyltransferase CheR
MFFLETESLHELLGEIREKYGYDFTGYAEASVKRRIHRFSELRKIVSYAQLRNVLLEDEASLEGFIQELSVTVTEMFRDPDFYLALRKTIIKRLATYPVIRVWVAGCATGEEVYSTAILLEEEDLLSRSVIYATDINQRSLQLAKEGIYPISAMKSYTANYQKAGGSREFSTYYKAKYGSAMFDKNLRKNIIFYPHNLVADKSFNEFHLVLCRNVLIYFKQELQNKVINLFHESLCIFGVLGLGSKESLLFTDKKKSFQDIAKRQKIYMKVAQ